MNIISYGSYYTVIKNRDDKEIVNNKHEDNEIDYISFNVFFLLLIIILEEKIKKY